MEAVNKKRTSTGRLSQTKKPHLNLPSPFLPNVGPERFIDDPFVKAAREASLNARVHTQGHPVAFRCLPLCSGAGGDALGAYMAGFDIVGVCDTNLDCLEFTKYHFGLDAKYVFKTMYAINVKDFNPWYLALFCGIPCIGASTAGLREGLNNEEVRDAWNALLALLLRFKQEWNHLPTLFIEQPMGATSTPVSNVDATPMIWNFFLEARTIFSSVAMSPFVMDTFGVEQRRERIIIAASCQVNAGVVLGLHRQVDDHEVDDSNDQQSRHEVYTIDLTNFRECDAVSNITPGQTRSNSDKMLAIYQVGESEEVRFQRIGLDQIPLVQGFHSCAFDGCKPSFVQCGVPNAVPPPFACDLYTSLQNAFTDTFMGPDHVVSMHNVLSSAPVVSIDTVKASSKMGEIDPPGVPLVVVSDTDKKDMYVQQESLVDKGTSLWKRKKTILSYIWGTGWNHLKVIEVNKMKITRRLVSPLRDSLLENYKEDVDSADDENRELLQWMSQTLAKGGVFKSLKCFEMIIKRVGYIKEWISPPVNVDLMVGRYTGVIDRADTNRKSERSYEVLLFALPNTDQFYRWAGGTIVSARPPTGGLVDFDATSWSMLTDQSLKGFSDEIVSLVRHSIIGAIILFGGSEWDHLTMHLRHQLTQAPIRLEMKKPKGPTTRGDCKCEVCIKELTHSKPVGRNCLVDRARRPGTLGASLSLKKEELVGYSIIFKYLLKIQINPNSVILPGTVLSGIVVDYDERFHTHDILIPSLASGSQSVVLRARLWADTLLVVDTLDVEHWNTAELGAIKSSLTAKQSANFRGLIWVDSNGFRHILDTILPLSLVPEPLPSPVHPLQSELKAFNDSTSLCTFPFSTDSKELMEWVNGRQLEKGFSQRRMFDLLLSQGEKGGRSHYGCGLLTKIEGVPFSSIRYIEFLMGGSTYQPAFIAGSTTIIHAAGRQSKIILISERDMTGYTAACLGLLCASSSRVTEAIGNAKTTKLTSLTDFYSSTNAAAQLDPSMSDSILGVECYALVEEGGARIGVKFFIGICTSDTSQGFNIYGLKRCKAKTLPPGYLTSWCFLK